MASLIALLVLVTALIHLAFALFAAFGGLLVLRNPRMAWLHIPAVLWAIWIEAAGGICPLTPLENMLRERAGLAGYAGGFLEHYLFAALYPEGLTRTQQLVLAVFVLVINVIVYGILLYRRGSRRG